MKDNNLWLTASLADRLVGLWLVIASQKVVYKVQDEMAKLLCH